MRLVCRTSCRAEKSAGDRAKRFGGIDSNGFDSKNNFTHFAGAAVEFAWLVSEKTKVASLLALALVLAGPDKTRLLTYLVCV